MNPAWLAQLVQTVDPAIVRWDLKSRTKFSKDYYDFSPVLADELPGHVAEAVVRPRSEEELEQVIHMACDNQVPLTVRGAGTGNYGQAVPLRGGLVVDLTGLSRVLEIGDGFLRAEAGARLGDLEAKARAAGQELLAFPSTFKTATVGGFVQGGSGGVGSVRWGMIWDGMVREMTGKTMHATPRTFCVSGDAVQPYLHSYGTLGIVTTVTVLLAPRTHWEQWALTFGDLTSAYAFAETVAHANDVATRLVSVHERPIAGYFSPLGLDPSQAVVLLEVGAAHHSWLMRQVERWGGQVAIDWSADRYHKGTGVSDFSWNHTTLWARKQDRTVTYLQTRFDPERALAQIHAIQDAFPEFMVHLEFLKEGEQVVPAGLPLVRYQGRARLQRLMDYLAEVGVGLANPHTWWLNEGGRTPPLDQFWRLKDANDPYGLLNPGKVRRETMPASV
jgi:FAD/FMN-containing dehydrogenase